MREDIREAFVRQADSCRGLGSPFNATLCELLAARLTGASQFARAIEAWGTRPVPDALALRAVGGLHALARSGRAPSLRAVYPPASTRDVDNLWAVVESAIAEHDDFLTNMLASPPQTNEVARSAVLLGAALTLGARHGLPLCWYELGASAGLNLSFDQYRYELEQGAWGSPSASVTVRASWTGKLPPLDAALQVSERAGCDVAPLDARSATDRERLLSYVWPDQQERLARTEAALTFAAASSILVERSPASRWLARKLAQPAAPGTLRVVAHTIVWQYLDQEERVSLRETLHRAGELASADTPLAWFSMEADGNTPGAAMKLTVWPGGQAEDLGRADFHGRWVAWQ